MSAELAATLELATAGTPIMAPPIPVVQDEHPFQLDPVPAPAKPGFFKRVWRKLSHFRSASGDKP